ncbi:MAG: helix-turn-helix transcriptional regulator [Hyphomicrobiaceae bacterium]|nr:MAG: helix-turn-helix transcriptional regulator [Hyphomicrobiaceae bacterium]
MTVSEVADYLRIRERTIYELVRTHRIPCSRLSGKLLFPKRLIELWVAQSSDYPQAAVHLAAPPPVVAGSHDPLLEWSLRESDSELALLGGGSTDGLARLAGGQATACGLHLIDAATGEYGTEAIEKALPGLDFVVIEWARREQGLVVAPGNPLKIEAVKDLKKAKVRVAKRQVGSGSALLFSKLVEDAGLAMDDLTAAGKPARSETDIGIMVRDKKADVGLAIRAAAREVGLDFVPLQWERFDLVVRRIEYFEPPMQKLLAFARMPEFADRAATLGGYDVSGTGRVVLNPRR